MSQFLTYYADVPYLITWTEGQGAGVLAGEVADKDYLGAQPFRQTLPIEMAKDVGVEILAEQIAAWHHCAAAGRRH